MKFIIKHEIRGRIRIHAAQSRMSAVQADTLAYYVGKLEGVTSVKVQECGSSGAGTGKLQPRTEQ